MFDTELVNEILSQILTAAHRIERRCEDIFEPDNFLVSDAGIDRLDAICKDRIPGLIETTMKMKKSL